MFKNIYREKIPEVFNKLKTSKEGLSKKDVVQRQETYGLNTLPETKGKPLFKMIFAHIHNPLIYVLFVTALFSLVIGHQIDAVIIIIVVLLNLTIGVYHEIKAQKIIKSLESFSAPTCIVRRNGKVCEIEVSELVPGDIVLLKEGDKIPADLRVIYALNVIVHIVPSHVHYYTYHMQTHIAQPVMLLKRNLPHVNYHRML